MEMCIYRPLRAQMEWGSGRISTLVYLEGLEVGDKIIPHSTHPLLWIMLWNVDCRIPPLTTLKESFEDIIIV